MTVVGTEKRSCTTCPQLLTERDQSTGIGKSIGGAMCGVKLLAIGRPGSNTLHPDKQGKTCSDWGTERSPLKPEAMTAAIELKVAFPNGALANDSAMPEAVTSCSSCEHYLPSGTVMVQTGWRTGLCAAKGTLLLDERLRIYARDCAYKKVRPYRPYGDESNVVINLLPEYQDNYGRPDPMADYRKALTDAGEPTNYPTDKSVDDRARSLGIRAYRKIQDPKGVGPDIFLPVFELASFGEEDQKIVPRTGDDEHPEDYIDWAGHTYRIAVMWRRLRETPAIWGQAGIGKTEMFRYLAWMMVLPFERVSITRRTELDDLAGKMLFSPEKGTYFRYGRVSRAWIRRCLLDLDESNTANPEVWQYLRPLTDDSKNMVLDMNEGEVLQKHPACFMGMTNNPAWDIRNIGAEPLADADGSRLMHIMYNMPPAHIELEIIKRRLLRDGFKHEAQAISCAKKSLEVCVELRKLSDAGTLPVSISPRTSIKVARLKPYMSWMDAFRMAVADALDPEGSRIVLDKVREYCGED